PPSYTSQSPPKINVGPSEEQRYNKTPVFRDIWAAILFALVLASFVVFSVLAIQSLPAGTFSGAGAMGSSTSFYSRPTFICFALVAAAAFVLSLGYLGLMQLCPRVMIIVSFWFSVAVGIGTAAYYFYRRLYWVAVLALIFAIVYALMWFYARKRIPFATVMLTTVMDITRRFPATLGLGVGFLLLNLAFCLWWAVTLISTFSYMKKYESCSHYVNSAGRQDVSCSNGPLIGVIVYLCFVWFWVTQVIYNVLHTTVAGVFATFYFFEGSPMGYPTTTPTASALKRATTNSFGSVCFGSLLVAIFQTIRGILQTLMNSNSDDAVGAFIACCIGCILAQIQALLEFFNKYAYIQVAIYGKPFIPAAKDTWRLLTTRGIDLLINDDLVGNVVAMGGILVGAVCAIIGYVFVSTVDPAYNATGTFTPIIILVSFFIGISLFFIPGQVIDSGNAATFVCLAEDPAALMRSKPMLFEQIRQSYPQVVDGLHV
ncbi:putative choline transporter, neither null mutation nor overexpression affects choline transport, partial [Dimargaris verticillata]